MKCPYFKPTRRVHESGYRMFEIGYCDVENETAVNIEVVATSPDALHLNRFLDDNQNLRINLDLTKNGYIRILEDFKWDIPGFSDAWLRKNPEESL